MDKHAILPQLPYHCHPREITAFALIYLHTFESVTRHRVARRPAGALRPRLKGQRHPPRRTPGRMPGRAAPRPIFRLADSVWKATPRPVEIVSSSPRKRNGIKLSARSTAGPERAEWDSPGRSPGKPMPTRYPPWKGGMAHE